MRWLQQNAVQLLFILFSGIALYVGSETRLTSLELRLSMNETAFNNAIKDIESQELSISRNNILIQNLTDSSLKMAPVITKLSDSLFGLERVLTAEQADKARVLDHIASVRTSQEKTEKKIEELSKEVQTIKVTIARKGN